MTDAEMLARGYRRARMPLTGRLGYFNPAKLLRARQRDDCVWVYFIPRTGKTYHECWHWHFVKTLRGRLRKGEPRRPVVSGVEL